MSKPVYFTSVAEREGFYPERKVNLPCPQTNARIIDDEYDIWWDTYNWLVNFTVHIDNFEEAKKLADELFKLQDNIDHEREMQVVNELLKLRAKPADERTDVEFWSHMAVQMPGDIGGAYKKEIRNLLTERARRRVLESCCGFNSYVDDDPNIEEVLVLDYCPEMLERYPRPDRKRVLFDLENVVKGDTISIFPDERFDTVFCYGSNYFSQVVPVFKEFKRLLSNKGKLVIIENNKEGYEKVAKRRFNPEDCAAYMKAAGLYPRVEYLPIRKNDWFRGEYFLVEGFKE